MAPKVAGKKLPGGPKPRRRLVHNMLFYMK